MIVQSKNEIYLTMIEYHLGNALFLSCGEFDWREALNQCPPTGDNSSETWHIAVAMKYLDRIKINEQV